MNLIFEVEEEEIYINLFDRYNRNEIDYTYMVQSYEEIDGSADLNSEFQCYQTALNILEQAHIKSIAQDAIRALST